MRRVRGTTTKVVAHGGAIPGYSADFYFFPETGFGFIAFAGADGVDHTYSLLTALASFSGLTETQTAPVSVSPTAPTNPGYAGTFEDGSGLFGQYIVTDDDGTFGISMPVLDALGITYQPKLTEYAQGGFFTVVTGVSASASSSELSHFIVPGLALTFDFLPSPGGHFDQVTNGGYFPGRRVGGLAAPVVLHGVVDEAGEHGLERVRYALLLLPDPPVERHEHLLGYVLRGARVAPEHP